MKKKKVKKKFKVLLFFLIIISIGIGYTAATIDKNNDKKENNKTTKENSFIKECKKLDYYKKENNTRYYNYKKKNKDLSAEDIVIRVNIGLDYKYYTHTSKSKFLNDDKILVNKYIYVGEDYEPNNLEDIPKEYARSGMKLVKNAKDAFVEMAKAAKENNTPIIAMSSYRDYKYQVDLYNRYKNKDGKEAADTYSARPGFSEHQTGLCVDIYDGVIDYTNFEKSKSFEWMKDNSYKYGFILRYPKEKEDITGYTYESWHYRYVGKEIAKYIHNNNITFDEYYVKFIDK